MTELDFMELDDYRRDFAEQAKLQRETSLSSRHGRYTLFFNLDTFNRMISNVTLVSFKNTSHYYNQLNSHEDLRLNYNY